MKAAISIFKRETSAYFAAPMGWIILLFFTFIFGFFFSLSVHYFLQYSAQAAFNPEGGSPDVNSFVIQGVFGNMAIVAILVAPGLVMRLLAEDRKQKSIELLLTSPISSFEIVMGKFLGSMGFVGAMLAATLPFTVILYTWGQPDTGVLAMNYLSLALLMGTLVSANLFLSSFTDNQVIAFIVAFGFNLIFWILGWVAEIAPGSLQAVLQTIAFGSHYMEMTKGLLKLQDIVYFITFIGFCLLATTQRVEALRWR